MSKAKAVCFPLVGHFKLSSKQCPTSEKDVKEMSRVPYAYAVGILTYAWSELGQTLLMHLK